MNSDISKGKILTWLGNAKDTIAEARNRAGDTKEGARCEGKLNVMGILIDKIAQGQFNVENLFGSEDG